MQKHSSIWPKAIIAFFIIAITGIIFYVRFTRGHKMDLVSDNYYEQEINYQDRIDAAKRTLALDAANKPSWKLDSQRGLLVIEIPKSIQDGASGFQVALFRPSDKTLDRRIEMEPIPARSETRMSTLKPGLWKIQLSWTMHHESYWMEETMVIPGGGA